MKKKKEQEGADGEGSGGLTIERLPPEERQPEDHRLFPPENPRG